MEFNEYQLETLKKLSTERYIAEVIEHCTLMFPLLFSSVKAGERREFIAQAIKLAKKNGYTQRGPVRLYVDTIILFGADFEQDPLLQSFRSGEESGVTQIERSVALYALLRDYLRAVHGENGVHFKASLRALREFNPRTLSWNSKNSHADLHQLLKAIYPQKYEFAGAKAIDRLLLLAEQYSARHGWNRFSRLAWVAVIMFLFGCAFERDYFRNKFIGQTVIDFINDDDIANHSAIVSHYACYTLNNSSCRKAATQ